MGGREKERIKLEQIQQICGGIILFFFLSEIANCQQFSLEMQEVLWATAQEDPQFIL